MLKISDKIFLIEIVADAITKAHLACASENLRDKWINAIAEATAILEGDTSLFHWDSFENVLRFLLPDNVAIYTSTDRECESCATWQGSPTPCVHRALSRLVGNYFELQRKPGENIQIDFAAAVFFDRELTARHKIELLNLSISAGRDELKPLVETLEKHSIS